MFFVTLLVLNYNKLIVPSLFDIRNSVCQGYIYIYIRLRIEILFVDKAIPLFFYLLSNAFSDFGSVGRKKKKKNKKDWKKSLELGGPVPQHNIRGCSLQYNYLCPSSFIAFLF